MAACGCYRKSAFYRFLPFYIRKIYIVIRFYIEKFFHIDISRFERQLPCQITDSLSQSSYTENFEV